MATQRWIAAGAAALATLAFAGTPAAAGSLETESRHNIVRVRDHGATSFHFSFGASKHHGGFKRHGFKQHGFKRHGFRAGHRDFHGFRAHRFGHRGFGPRGFKHHRFTPHRLKHHRFKHGRFRHHGAGRWTRPSHW